MQEIKFLIDFLCSKPNNILEFKGNIVLTKVDDNWLSNPMKITKRFNSLKKMSFNLKKGYYTLEINIFYKKRKFKFFKENIYINFGKLLEISSQKNKIEIDIENQRNANLNQKEVEEKFNKIRSDKDKCFFCHKKFSSYGDCYLCSHCGRYYCGDHRIPEFHGCKGNILRENNYRKIFSGKNTKFEY